MSARKKITLTQFQAAYEAAKRVYSGVMPFQEARRHLERTADMNRNSSQDYILCYEAMRKGLKYTRTTSEDATRYYLERILQDEGTTALQIALEALRQHLDFYEDASRANVIGKRKILEEFNRLAVSTVSLSGSPTTSDDPELEYPDEFNESENYLEGKVCRVLVNKYERNQAARDECVARRGCKCSICGFDFEESFGEIGRDFIHVHHLVEISSIGQAYKIDPITDLAPVCPNCHAMLHRKKPAFTLDELKARRRA